MHPKEPKRYDKLEIDYKTYLREYFDFAAYIEENAHEENYGKA